MFKNHAIGGVIEAPNRVKLKFNGETFMFAPSVEKFKRDCFAFSSAVNRILQLPIFIANYIYNSLQEVGWLKACCNQHYAHCNLLH
jgi:hypothetical protein